MSLLTTSAVRAPTQQGVPYNFSAASILTERLQKQASAEGHDIFLSHAFDDNELILGVALTLEDLGYTVYLDWRDDPSLDRKNVNQVTGLRWVPWVLGFKDGHNS